MKTRVTNDNPSHSIRNGIIVVVIGGIIITYLIPGLFGIMKSVASYFWHLLTATYEVKGWFLVLLELLSIAVVIQVLVRVFGRDKITEPEWKRYVEDRLFGIVWHWSYVGQNIQNLWCYCPVCKIQLVYHEKNQYSHLIGSPPNTDFFCEKCAEVKATLKGDKDYALASVEREIDRKLRPGEWKSTFQPSY